jgi:hypothetical protein
MVVLEAKIDGEVVADIECNLPRPDLVAEGHPERAGFNIQLPRRFFDGERHVLSLLADGRPIGFHVSGNPCREHVFAERWVPPLHSNVDGFQRGVIKG